LAAAQAQIRAEVGLEEQRDGSRWGQQARETQKYLTSYYYYYISEK
jgi:hypothetical protein